MIRGRSTPSIFGRRGPPTQVQQPSKLHTFRLHFLLAGMETWGKATEDTMLAPLIRPSCRHRLRFFATDSLREYKLHCISPSWVSPAPRWLLTPPSLARVSCVMSIFITVRRESLLWSCRSAKQRQELGQTHVDLGMLISHVVRMMTTPNA